MAARILSCLKIDHVPATLTRREKEVNAVTLAIENSINKPGGEGHVLYLYGQPGTGKSATVKSVMQSILTRRKDVQFHDINLLSLTSPAGLFPALAVALTGKKRSISAAFDVLEKLFRSGYPGKIHHVILLDEFDNVMTSKGGAAVETFHTRLYSLFDWPTRPAARLTLICVANTLCLPQHLMPRCFSRLGFGHINFRNYDHEDLMAILEARFEEVGSSADMFFELAGLQLLCRKVASLTGDVRVALDFCRQMIQKKSRRSKVRINEVNQAAARLFTSATSEFALSLPLHPQVLLLCAAYLHSQRNTPDPCLGFAIAGPRLFETYSGKLNQIVRDETQASDTFNLALEELVDAGAVQTATFLQVCTVDRRKQRCDPSVLKDWGQTAVSLLLPAAEILHGVKKGPLKEFSCVITMCNHLDS